MKYLNPLLIICFALQLSFGQGDEKKKIMEPIDRMFEGMKKGDSAMVHSTFHPALTFATVFTDSKTSQPTLRAEGMAGFLKAVGTPHKEVWNELIWAPRIEIDGNFAQVWVDYAFYVDKNFNHCGVDAFHLFRDSTGSWRIFHLADTRRKADCNIPKEISDKMK